MTNSPSAPRPCVTGTLFPLLLAVLGCGKGDTSPTTTIDCDGVAPTTLAAGAQVIIDPALTQGCLRLPAAGAQGAEHLVVALSAAGQETPNGVQSDFILQATTDTFSVPALRRPALVQGASASAQTAFDLMLRERERVYAREIGIRRAPSVRPSVRVPPVVGDQRSFKVCKTATCASFVTVGATAKFVGAHGAIFLDDTVPAGGYTQTDIDSIGALFEQYLYPIDTTAFGRESDIDGNGVVIALLTDRINALSPNCAQTGQFIAGYFFGLDLLNDPNSNGGEVFYGLVPDPGVPLCFAKDQVQRRLGGTFIHEFQHMISYNRHVLLGGGEAEETWLNEGLSHFAEELGGRLVPDAFCPTTNCLTQYVRDDLSNARDYFNSPESYALVEAGTSNGSLPERGANWLFVRWLADRSPTDSVLGTDMTRRLNGAGSPGGLTTTGGQNVVAAAALFQPGISFSTLVGQWHLANFAESRGGFTEPSGRLGYRSWDLAAAFDALFPAPTYPLRPDSTDGSDYASGGILRGGSGVYLRIVQGTSGAAVALGLDIRNSGAVQPRYAVVRLR
ncbi:MAG: hypothetical protein SGJ01_15595 [Gemmatimonadota bacterium]|nr:hypothetical protein [Gemmatimonadota bacterium]